MLINSKLEYSLTPINGAAVLLASYLAVSLLYRIFCRRNRLKTTEVDGPPRKSWFYGYAKQIASDAYPFNGPLRDWALEFGPVHRIPWVFGGDNLVVCDPKAVGYILGKDTWGYKRDQTQTRILHMVIGHGGIMSSEGEQHKTIRRVLTPAFTNAAFRSLAPVFFDAVEKVKSYWDQELSSSPDGSAVFDIQNWMNRISFDNIGSAGFSHEFSSLDGKLPPLFDFIRDLGEGGEAFITTAVVLLGSIPDFLFDRLPVAQNFEGLGKFLEAIAAELLRTSKDEKKAGITSSDRSIVDILLGKNDLTSKEVLAQMNTLIIAGFETTAVAMTWAMIELCQNPSIQTKLRAEIHAFGGEPTWDDLMSATKLPYLDAFIHECLRLHPPVQEMLRTAAEDDIVALSQPITTRSGTIVSELIVSKGQNIVIPVQIIHTLPSLWGEDAMVFKPERWIDESGGEDSLKNVRAKEISAYRHLLTFADGPRTCLGKSFALAEMKSVLSALIRSYTFEFADGPDTKISWKRGLTPRPSTGDHPGPYVYIRVRRVD